MTETVEEAYPQFWEGVPPKVIELGLKFGLIKLGWTLQDYIHHAIESMGYETILIWGVQGSGKSNFMLQTGYWVYHDWDLVLKNIVFKPEEFVRKLKRIPIGKRVPWIGWDDVGVHYASVSWRTNIQQYEAVDACWAAIRTKCNVITLTIPLIDRLARNLKDNITIEVFIGRNQNVLIERYIRLPSVKRGLLESTFYKVQVEPVHKIDLLSLIHI